MAYLRPLTNYSNLKIILTLATTTITIYCYFNKAQDLCPIIPYLSGSRLHQHPKL